MYREGRRSICLGRNVTRLICLSGCGSPRLARRMLFRNNGFLLWILCFFLGTSSSTCSSSSLSRLTTTSGQGDQPSLVMVHKYLGLGSSSRTDDPRATGSVDLRATAIVLRGSTKNPSESLGNTYEDGLNSSWSRERNLVAGDGASTASSSGTGGGVPTGASSKPLWIVGSALPPATTVAT